MKPTLQTLFTQIRVQIARDEMPAALSTLRGLLENTPRLNEILQQSGRLENIRQQMRTGTVSHYDATLEQNRIRLGVLELLAEIEKDFIPTAALDDLLAAVEQESTRTEVREEVEKAVSIVNSKNVVVNSSITAGGNVEIGDRTIYTESQTSRRLKLFLLVFVPLLVLALAYVWYQAQPLTLSVAVRYQALNPDLAFEKGALILYHGGIQDQKTIETEAVFTDIRRGEKVSLSFKAEGFLPIDTVFVPSGKPLILPIQHDNSLARVFGTVRDEQGRAIVGATIRVQDMKVQTSSDGSFSLSVPPEKQRKQQRVEVIVNGKVVWDLTQPILADAGIEIQL